MSTEDSFRGVELLDFMWNDDSTTCASNISQVGTAEPPLLLSIPFDFDMLGPPEINTSYMLYPKNITKAPTWEIAVKVSIIHILTEYKLFLVQRVAAYT